MTRTAITTPGSGVLQDRHPGLVWMAAGGLLLAMLLGTLGMPPLASTCSPTTWASWARCAA